MDYQVKCPHCAMDVGIMAVQIGQPLRCPGCRNTFVVTLPGAAGPAGMVGRPFSFACDQCGSRLEAYTGMVGQRGQCPTCGAEFTIPLPYGQSVRVGGTEPEKEYAQPVHAYAAAGAKAPRIVRQNDGQRAIECPRCQTANPVSRNNCSRCAMPFTLEGTETSAGQGSGLATASLVLGIVGIPGGCVMAPSLLAVLFGVLAMRGQGGEGAATGRSYPIAGIVLGILGAGIGIVFWLSKA